MSVSPIGPAWLLLSHSGFLSAMLVANSIGFTFLVTSKTTILEHSHRAMQGLSILWCALSLIIGAWVIYAIMGTWKENRKVVNPTYGDGGFITLIIIVICIMITCLWTMTEIGIN